LPERLLQANLALKHLTLERKPFPAKLRLDLSGFSTRLCRLVATEGGA
jgi:hypothetical protein